MDYTLIRSSRRTLSIQIGREGQLIARAPMRLSVRLIEDFIETKKSWIEKHVQKVADRKQKVGKKEYTETEIREMKAKLMKYLIYRVPELWQGTNLPKYTSIKITKSERRWGSCSGKNGLCFSYRLAEWLDIPPILSPRGTRDLLQSETEADSSYRQNDKTRFIEAVIVHELAHLREKHHQASFWKLVYAIMPEYESVMKNRTIDG